MPLNRSLVDADDSVDVLYGVLCALMLALPEAVRETFPADALQNDGYCHIAALHTLRLSDLEEIGVLRGHARMSAVRLLLVAVPSSHHPESAEKKMFWGSRVIFISGGGAGAGGKI